MSAAKKSTTETSSTFTQADLEQAEKEALENASQEGAEGDQAPEGTEGQTEGGTLPEGGSEAPASNVIDFSKFTLAVDEDIAIDEGAAIQRESDLPFKAFFTDNFLKAMTGGHPSSYCPIAFIQHRSDTYMARVNKPKKLVKHGDVRSKIADQFKVWQNDDAGRKSVKLQFANRTGAEENDKAAKAMGPGVRFWLVKA